MFLLAVLIGPHYKKTLLFAYDKKQRHRSAEHLHMLIGDQHFDFFTV